MPKAYENMSRNNHLVCPDDVVASKWISSAENIQLGIEPIVLSISGCQQSHEDGETKNTLPSRACINGA